VDEVAVTVIGRDRPGIIADVSELLAGLGMNLTDSTMTRLRGHFAMMLVCVGGAGVEDVEAALSPLTADGDLAATVRRLSGGADAVPRGGHYVLAVRGCDRLGIVAGVTRAVAEYGANITDLTTRLAGDRCVVVAELDLPAGSDDELLRGRLAALSAPLGVELTLRPAEPDPR
jgi:glycine cleavage system transcriptional repressor